jgi:hypothetical protein
MTLRGAADWPPRPARNCPVHGKAAILASIEGKTFGYTCACTYRYWREPWPAPFVGMWSWAFSHRGDVG